ncbi:Helix-turn-helix transcriptional regulator [Candidatus Trichorickettsia mobilis]|uniref:Helix-turn-helix transcriptional regulator n=1 Tax=Candidatus Trichorickettsia mobilis TaxID=1346319 RepID=A0ABZ0URK8_9RICK|nr:helix-turn-helix domain-containing protein [Candidatus Trichorickettsia mobilis]WPY00680.1 Helix-turn-helix transcriptional regulator [Candidatus Trichorickettsia mobilis]
MSENAEITKGRADSIDHLVSRRLKIRRMMLGYSQQELSEAAADVSIQQVQKYEKATNRISSGKLYSFSKFLKVPVNYFFDQEDTTLESIFAEDHEEYGESQPNNSSVTEKEVIALVKAFGEIKDVRVRKKIIELIKSMS